MSVRDDRCGKVPSLPRAPRQARTASPSHTRRRGSLPRGPRDSLVPSRYLTLRRGRALIVRPQQQRGCPSPSAPLLRDFYATEGGSVPPNHPSRVCQLQGRGTECAAAAQRPQPAAHPTQPCPTLSYVQRQRPRSHRKTRQQVSYEMQSCSATGMDLLRSVLLSAGHGEWERDRRRERIQIAMLYPESWLHDYIIILGRVGVPRTEVLASCVSAYYLALALDKIQ